MDAALQCVELDVAVGVADHQLAVEHVTTGWEAQLGKVTRQGFAAPRLDVGIGAVDEDDRAEAIELLLICPLLASRQLFAGLGQLRFDRRLERKGQSDSTVCRRARARASRGSGIGTAASNAFVYGSCGCSQTRSAGPSSTILPSCMTA